MTSCGAPAALESLECRTLLSGAASAASAETYDVLRLIGYDKRGASYRYRVEQTGLSFLPARFTLRTAISAQQRVYDGKKSDIVKASAPGYYSTTAWYSDTTGSYLMMLSGVFDQGSLSVQLRDTRLAPRTAETGRIYSDDGTFNGSFKLNNDRDSVTGTYRGTTRVTAQIFGREQIRVRGTTYQAVKGAYTIRLSGKYTFETSRGSHVVPAKIVLTTTVWAVPGTGIVKEQSYSITRLTPAGQVPTTIRATMSGELVSYILP